MPDEIADTGADDIHVGGRPLYGGQDQDAMVADQFAAWASIMNTAQDPPVTTMEDEMRATPLSKEEQEACQILLDLGYWALAAPENNKREILDGCAIKLQYLYEFEMSPHLPSEDDILDAYDAGDIIKVAEIKRIRNFILESGWREEAQPREKQNTLEYAPPLPPMPGEPELVDADGNPVALQAGYDDYEDEENDDNEDSNEDSDDEVIEEPPPRSLARRRKGGALSKKKKTSVKLKKRSRDLAKQQTVTEEVEVSFEEEIVAINQAVLDDIRDEIDKTRMFAKYLRETIDREEALGVIIDFQKYKKKRQEMKGMSRHTMETQDLLDMMPEAHRRYWAFLKARQQNTRRSHLEKLIAHKYEQDTSTRVGKWMRNFFGGGVERGGGEGGGV